MIRLSVLEKYRIKDRVSYAYGEPGCDLGGAFCVSGKGGAKLNVIASSGEGWDHVSVSLPHRCPTWDEMETVKRLFFKPDETAMQLHVPVAAHISVHTYCLHLWRPHDVAIPLPPAVLV